MAKATQEVERTIRALICREYAEDGVQPHEVVLKDNGDIVIDRRRRFPRTTPVVVGTWT